MMPTTHSGYTTSTAPGCSCGCSSPCASGEGSGMERTRFFPRQLVTPDDLTQDQLYFRDKGLRHNRLLHGWGVVCGARVMAHATDPCRVIVEAGYILGPYGHEIVIDHDVEVDLCHEGIDGNAVSPCGALDPWCSDVRVSRPTGRPVYVAVKYAECEARPVRAHGHACGCEEAACEFSRIRDGFAIRVLNDLPSSYPSTMPQPNIDNTVRCAVNAQGQVIARACPPCPPEPWVVLADVTLNNDGRVQAIDCFSHRRYVVSFADYYFLCRPRAGVGGIGVRESDILVDRGVQAAGGGAARMMIALNRPEGTTVYLPIHFDVQRGETLGSLISREGSREFVDPETDEVMRLADIYAMAGANPSTAVTTIADAVTPLQGLRLRVADLEAARAQLGALFDASGTESLADEHAGAPAAAPRLPATAVRGVNPSSTLGRKLGSTRVEDVAALSRTEFVDRMTEGVAANQQAAVREQAGRVWDASAATVALASTWRMPGV
jgi:hypothetical protein